MQSQREDDPSITKSLLDSAKAVTRGALNVIEGAKVSWCNSWSGIAFRYVHTYVYAAGFSPEPLSVMVHYSFHSEHYAWVLCTTSSTKPSATPSILSYRYYHRYYNPIVMREGGISGKVECVRMVTNRDIRCFFSIGWSSRETQKKHSSESLDDNLE